jgi:hypothetical protein
VKEREGRVGGERWSRGCLKRKRKYSFLLAAFSGPFDLV